MGPKSEGSRVFYIGFRAVGFWGFRVAIRGLRVEGLGLMV